MADLQTVRSDYWRNRDGSIVHTDECRYSGSKEANPWIYAQGRPRYMVRTLVKNVPWLRLCRVCWKETDVD